MNNLEMQIALWHERKFGKTVNIPSTYRKLLEEVGELGEALLRQDPVGIRDEIGDVVFTITHILRQCCPGQESLNLLLATTLDKVERRSFLEVKDGEPCGHPGCLNHVTHPCEGCGRIGGRQQDGQK